MGALSGRITGGLVSVGACAEIDATLCDIVPVSQYNYRMPGERETAYFVKDTRGMIMGFALYLGPPSSIGARLALINAFSDKVAFCAEYGITISEEDWPCHHIPRMLRTDHGELESEEFCQLVETLGITMELCAAYRGDQKPTVERNFGSLNTKVIHIENGNIKFRKDKKGLPPSAQTAELTHYEMMQKFIYYVLEQNKIVHTQRDPQSDWMQAAGIEHTPISIWKYCLRNGFSSLREVSPQEVRSALYFRTEGVLKADGIHVEIDKCHLHYTSPVISSEDWYRNVRFEEAHIAKKSQRNFTVLYHPMNIMHVYLLDPRGNREIQLTLKEEDSVYAQMPLFEVELTQDAEKKRLSSEKLHAKEATIEYNQTSRRISEHAHEVKPDLSGFSKAEIQRQRKVSAAQEKAHQFKRPQSHATVQEQDSLYDLQDSPFLHA